MNDAVKPGWQMPQIFGRWLDRFAASLGLDLERKSEIYLSLSQAATLKDANYWLQILFAAGVATLGLVLNSPAVIIGAMLISPLMGPILSAGLSLAAGDLILGFRAAAKLVISCLAAIGFAVLLVGLLPFKEMTGEIVARTQPNTLDLAVALFSGAIGSIATCKKAEGVVTSIPGVAIAVALMPPLCVAGYGIGLALSLNMAEGLRIAGGGGLLFLTNLVAITFTAMLVFLALRIDTSPVREKVREWRRADAESEWERKFLSRLRIPDKLRQIGGFPSRFLVILIPLLLILFPLSQSFSQLKQQYIQQRQENAVRRIANDFWQQQFAKLPNGEQRSVLDQTAISELNGKLTLALRVFTSKPYTAAERNEFTNLVATRLGRSPNSLEIQLLEIPTAAGLLAARARDEKAMEAPPTVEQSQTTFWQSVQRALQGLRLPPASQLYDYRVVIGTAVPLQVELIYLAERDIDADAQALMIDDLRARLNNPQTIVRFVRIPSIFRLEPFRRNQAILTNAMNAQLDTIGQLMEQHSSLRAEVSIGAEPKERGQIATERSQIISDYLNTKWQVASGRISVAAGANTTPTAVVKFQTAPEL